MHFALSVPNPSWRPRAPTRSAAERRNGHGAAVLGSGRCTRERAPRTAHEAGPGGTARSYQPHRNPAYRFCAG